MSAKVEVDLEEVKRIYLLMEELVSFFHQPMHYDTPEKLHAFLGGAGSSDGAFKKISNAYYETVWNWLPDEVQRQIVER